MPDGAWRVAILDSGVEPTGVPGVGLARRFVDEGTRVIECELVTDSLGHGTAVAGVIASASRPVQLLVAQVLNDRGRSSAATLAAAIDWALADRAQLLHLSLGLPEDRSVLREAIERAIRAGVLVVAATPARGAPVYPAAYPGVIRACGDARCEREAISHLGTSSVDFGACPVEPVGPARVARGASIGAAHLSRFIAGQLTPGCSRALAQQRLVGLAAFHGPERHACIGGNLPFARAAGASSS